MSKKGIYRRHQIAKKKFGTKKKKQKKKKQKLHPSQIRCCPLVHDTAAEQRCIMLDHMMDNFLLSW